MRPRYTNDILQAGGWLRCTTQFPALVENLLKGGSTNGPEMNYDQIRCWGRVLKCQSQLPAEKILCNALEFLFMQDFRCTSENFFSLEMLRS